MTTREHPTTVNGIETDVLKKTLDAIREDPELGACTFRVSNRWMGANRNRTTVAGFHGAKQDIEHQRPFELDADEPPILAGGDEAPNPVEHLLNALAGCMTTSMVAHAAARGIHIEEVESRVEGDIDLRGYLGLANDVPKGYTEIRVTFSVKTDEPDLKKLEALARYSPVFNTITHGANVEFNVERK